MVVTAVAAKLAIFPETGVAYFARVATAWVQMLLGRQWGLVLGPLLIVLGLLWPGWIRVPLPALALRATKPVGSLGAFILGGTFSVAVCPVCSPALFVVLGVSAGIGSPVMGVVLLTAFALGRAIPVASGALVLGALENWRDLAPFRRTFEIAGGVVLVVSGLYMLNAYYFWIPALAI